MRNLISAALAGSAVLFAAGAAQADDHTTLNNRRDQAAQYCQMKGGKVINRTPFYNTNGPVTNWLRLAGSAEFCQFTGTDGSRIHVLLETLYTTQPSLAALAYYTRPRPNQPPNSGNPASFYCTQLGGSDLFGGVSAAGGGWVGAGSIDHVLEACVFPDMSSIDSWGLYYHARGIIRGVRLATVLRYHPTKTASR